MKAACAIFARLTKFPDCHFSLALVCIYNRSPEIVLLVW